MATQTAASYRAEAEVIFDHLIPPTVNEPVFTAMAAESAKKVMGDNCLIHQPAITGGEDFAFFLEKAPGAMVFMGVRNEDCGACWAQHHGKYNAAPAGPSTTASTRWTSPSCSTASCCMPRWPRTSTPAAESIFTNQRHLSGPGFARGLNFVRPAKAFPGKNRYFFLVQRERL